MKTKKNTREIDPLIKIAINNGMTIEHALFKHKVLEIIEKTKIYISNPIRSGYLNDTEELIKAIEKL